MVAVKKRRATASIRAEFIRQSREAALNAVQTYNNPLVHFKSQTFIVLVVIAWTYLLHAYYRREGIDYRYIASGPGRRKYARIGSSFKYWELEQCLKAKECPLDEATTSNLRFLIELRNRIEHQMVPGLDESMSARYQACALNYCHFLRTLFGEDKRIDHLLPYSLQFTLISADQLKSTAIGGSLPAGLQSFIDEFDKSLPDDVFNSPQFAVKLHLQRQAVNNRSRADAIVEFVDHHVNPSDLGEEVTVIVKDRERPKFRPTDVVAIVTKGGFPRFKIHHHSDLWKSLDAKNSGKGYGVEVSGTWYWYESWVEVVRDHCRSCGERYR